MIRGLCDRVRRWLVKRKRVKKGNKFIEKRLKEKVPGYGQKVKRIPFDSKFWLVDQGQMKKIIKKDMTQVREYARDLFDCENFSFMFMTHLADKYDVNQAGVVADYSSAHAYNIIIFPDGRVRLFEPQQDKLFKIEERNKKEYALENALILI